MSSLSPRRRRITGLLAAMSLALAAIPAMAAATSIDAADGCDEPLAVISPTGSSGDLSAVAVTSQVLEQGVEGWADVSWQAFDDTQLTSVTIVGSEGQVTLTQDLGSGLASNVTSLIFCGTAGSSR